MTINYRPINEVTVQSFYLIPADKQHVPGFDHDFFLKVIDLGLEHVKEWHNKKLGCTFQFENTKKLFSDKNFNWFSANNINQADPTSFQNCYDEIRSLGYYPSKKRPILCYLYGGFKGCALGDFSFLPLEDVFLLLKEYNENKPGRWYGGLAHELSHSLGLDDVHNDNNKYNENLDGSKYLMGTGYFSYPNTELTSRNIDILKCKNPTMIITPALAPDPNQRKLHNP